MLSFGDILAFLFKSMVPAILGGLYPAETYPYNTPYPIICSQIFEGSQVKKFWVVFLGEVPYNLGQKKRNIESWIFLFDFDL